MKNKNKDKKILTELGNKINHDDLHVIRALHSRLLAGNAHNYIMLSDDERYAMMKFVCWIEDDIR